MLSLSGFSPPRCGVRSVSTVAKTLSENIGDTFLWGCPFIFCMKTDLTVAAYIFAEIGGEPKVLLIHHKKSALWLPVGGHIDPGEIPDEAMAREAKEETNLDIEFLQQEEYPVIESIRRNCALPFHCNVHNVGDHDHYCLFYLCKAKNPEEMEPNAELLGAEWFSLKELEQERLMESIRLEARRAFALFSAF